MAKMADVFGRFEAFCLSIIIYVLGYIQMAASNNVQTYASAQIFYSAGSTGLQILQQVFIADSSDLLNRALFALLPEFPFLVTVWIGPTIADSILAHASWRWGYGMWAIILPATFLPLALTLLFNQRKAKRLRLIKQRRRKQHRTFYESLRSTWLELDMSGLLLLSAAVSLLLIPLTLAANSKGGWHDNRIILMLVLGCVFLVLFPAWESSRKLAPKPLLSLHLLTERTALAGCALAFFYFSMCIPCGAFFPISRQETYCRSGLLFLGPTVLVLLLAGGTELRRCCRGSGYANLFLHLNNCSIYSIATD